MAKITFTGHRLAHFNFFNAMASPHFGITANVDITELLELTRGSASIRFTPALVYLLSRAAMEVRPFRWRVRRGHVFENANVRPSFAVPTEGSDAFSFCTVPYASDPLVFHADCVAEMEKMWEAPSMEDEPDIDDFLYMSAFPWASFTSVTHAMPAAPGDSVPRITWGKYFREGEKILMPLAVQAHHAVVDGSDLGKYYQVVEKLLKKSAEIFGETPGD